MDTFACAETAIRFGLTLDQDPIITQSECDPVCSILTTSLEPGSQIFGAEIALMHPYPATDL